jgi:hypothetical protein
VCVRALARVVRYQFERGVRFGDWSATVLDGVAILIDDYGDETDRHVADVIDVQGSDTREWLRSTCPVVLGAPVAF